MPRTISLVLSLTAALLEAHVALAQQEVIWSSVAITTFADRIPLLSPNFSLITPLGAQQMYNAGSFFRQRYITDSLSRTTIPNIAYNEINTFQTLSYTLSDPFVQQSAQAFMNGLYPPISGQNVSSAQLANGTTVTGPLNGQQYFWTQSYQPTDSNYVFMAASANCPAYDEEVRSNYTSQPAFQTTRANNQDRYNSINISYFDDAIPNRAVGYGASYEVWDYLNYMKIHNATTNPTDEDVAFTKNMADLFATHTTADTDSAILSLPGRAISSQILSALIGNADNNGTEFNMNLLFTSWEPLMSLAALLGMLDTDSNLHTIPNVGSSLVFELFSEAVPTSGSIGGAVPTYPTSVDDLRVRAYYRNGTVDGTNATFSTQSMGSVPSAGGNATTVVSFIETVAKWSMVTVREWCEECGNQNAIFCTGSEDSSSSSGSGTVTIVNTPSNALSPAVGGVIGAIVTLAVTGLVALGLMLIGGFRLRRDRPSVVASKGGLNVRKRRQSSMGGFKGAEKMASDVDLPKGGALVGPTVAPAHNRTVSWEMKEGGSPRLPNRDSQKTVVGEPGPEVGDTAGISIVKEEDEELEGMAPVKVRESF